MSLPVGACVDPAIGAPPALWNAKHIHPGRSLFLWGRGGPSYWGGEIRLMDKMCNILPIDGNIFFRNLHHFSNSKEQALTGILLTCLIKIIF